MIRRPEIITRIEEIGGNLALDADGCIRYRVPKHHPETQILLEQLKEEKPALVAYLKARVTQRQESSNREISALPGFRERMEDSGRRFGQPHARLFPLIGKQVWTRHGKGMLRSVFATVCEVCPEGAERTIRVGPEEVRVIQ